MEKKIRVQMVSSGIPAYQNDFETAELAIDAAQRLANGAKATQAQCKESELARFENKRGFVRVFPLN